MGKRSPFGPAGNVGDLAKDFAEGNFDFGMNDYSATGNYTDNM